MRRDPLMQSWIYRTSFEIFPPFRDALASESLDHFDLLMRSPVGEQVSFEPEKEVRKLTLSVYGTPTQFYLKRAWDTIPVLWFLKKIVRGKWQHSRAYNELRAVRELEQAGFDVMTPVAWGERRIAGIPSEGFLLTRAVDGPLAADIWCDGDRARRARMVNDLGRLFGRLHRHRFFSNLRLKDLVCVEVPNNLRGPIRFAQIDRESSSRGQVATSARCLSSLARLYVESLELDAEPTLGQMARFVKAYLEACGRHEKHSVRETVRDVSRHVRRRYGESASEQEILARSRFATCLIGMPRAMRKAHRHDTMDGVP